MPGGGLTLRVPEKMKLRQKIIFFPIAEGGAYIVGVFRVIKITILRQKIIFFSNFRAGGRRVRPPLCYIVLDDTYIT
jgi:hypothetical protein